MVYCKKCSRLLDEDVRICPFCGNEDENFTDNAFAAPQDDTADKLWQIDEQIAQNQQPPDTAPKTEYVDPSMVTVEPSAYTRPGAAPAADEKPSTGLYVGLVLLSIFLSLPGMITGIVYMTNKREAYRKMGLVVLIIGIVSTLLCLVSCCGFFYVIGASMTDFVY